MRWWRVVYGQSGFLNSSAEGPAPLQFALMPPRAPCILQGCTVIPPVVVISKGENLIGQEMGERNGKPVFQGIKSLRVEPGALPLDAIQGRIDRFSRSLDI